MTPKPPSPTKTTEPILRERIARECQQEFGHLWQTCAGPIKAALIEARYEVLKGNQ